jgi:16S rRNA processing protein RimM
VAGEWDEMVVVGRVARPHGRHGQVVVNPETDFLEERFQPGTVLFTLRDGAIETLRVETARFQRGRPIVGIDGVGSITEAEGLAGLELRVPLADLAALPAGSYYRHDLVGCEVALVSGQRVGHVRSVEGDSLGSRLVVATSEGDVLVPLAAHICVTVDPGARKIVIDPPEGLLELNR